MAYKKSLMVVAIVIVVIVLYALYVLHAKHASNKEQFTGPEMTPTMMKYSLNEYGMEKCDSLTLPNLDANAMIMNSKYVGGLRINKYKPVDALKLQSNKSYCMIYDDLAQNVQDYLLGDQTCSMQHKNFKGTPFITNVYSDTSQSYALGVPINSCVIEIDKTKVNAANLSAFWNAFGVSHCADLYNEWNQEVNACMAAKAAYMKYVTEEISSFNAFGAKTQKQINELEHVIASNMQELTDITQKLAQCTADMERCQADIAIARRDIQNTQSNIAGPYKNNLHQISQKSIINLNSNVDIITTLIGRNHTCSNNTALYTSTIQSLAVTQSQNEALYTLLQKLNGDMLGLINSYNGYITSLKDVNTRYLSTIATLNANIATVQDEITVEQGLLKACNSNVAQMKIYDATLQECKRETVIYDEAVRITLSNLNAEKRLFFKINASNNDCNQWTTNNKNVLGTLTDMYTSCSNNTSVVLGASSQCSADKLTCYDDLHNAKGAITNLNHAIDSNTTNIINLTNELLKCKTAIASSVTQSTTAITQTQNALNNNTKNSCMNTSTLQANIQVAIATLSNLQGQSQTKTIAPISCNDSDTLALINECHLIDKSNCPWPCGGVSPDFMYNLTCPGPMGASTKCAPSSCTANFVGTPYGTIECKNGIYTNTTLSGCTAPAGCSVLSPPGYIMSCTGNSGENCEAQSCDTNAGYNGTAIGGYGQCTNGVWSSPGGPTGCVAPKACDPPSYPGYGQGLMQMQGNTIVYSSGACETGYSGNSTGAFLKCDTVTGTWSGAPPTGCQLIPSCTINGLTFTLNDPLGITTGIDGSTINRTDRGYGFVILKDQIALNIMTVSTNSVVKTCIIVAINVKPKEEEDPYTHMVNIVNYSNECIISLGPSVVNKLISIADNCPRTDGKTGDNNMEGKYFAYFYRIIT